MQVSFDPGMMQKQGMEVSEVSPIKNVYTNGQRNWGAAAETGAIGEQVPSEWSKQAICYYYHKLTILVILMICLATKAFASINWLRSLSLVGEGASSQVQ